MFLISDIIMSASQHIAGMLDRDQRTVRCYQRYRRININEPVTVTSTTLSTSSTNSSTNSTTVPMTSTTSSSSSSSSSLTSSAASSFEWRTWRTSSSIITTTTTTTKRTQPGGCYGESKKRRTRKTRKSSWRITQRLRHLLVLLLSINYFPLISSAPTSKHNMSDRMNSHPKWINPCGMGQADTISVHDISDSVLSDKDLLNQIVLAAKLAYAEAENFREDYVQKTFGLDFQEHHGNWKSNRYDWLPSTEQIPKHLGEDAPNSHLKELELDKSLLDTYEYLQTIAVGLEQLVWDQEDDNAPFTGKFKEIEFKLRALLCEIQVAILERGIVMRPDVRRDIMTEAYRNNDNLTSKYLRDWLIFRDFMNALEYVIQVFNYLHDSL